MGHRFHHGSIYTGHLNCSAQVAAPSKSARCPPNTCTCRLVCTSRRSHRWFICFSQCLRIVDVVREAEVSSTEAPASRERERERKDENAFQEAAGGRSIRREAERYEGGRKRTAVGKSGQTGRALAKQHHKRQNAQCRDRPTHRDRVPRSQNNI